MNCGEEVSGGFIVTGCNGAVFLELAEEVFDEMACLVGVFVEVALDLRLLLGVSKASAAISGSSASAPSRSWACPGVRMKSSGLPNASTSA